MIPDFVPPQQQGGPRDNTMARFYTMPVQNNFRTEREGRPIFEEHEFVEIMMAGDTKTVVQERVKEEHRQRWPTMYAAFKAGREPPTEGTPIEEWAAITASQALELRACNVRTVEQMAELSDTLLMRAVPMGGHALRERAKAFLQQAAGSAPMDSMLAKMEEQNAIIATLQQQIKELAAQGARATEEADVSVGA
jgi:hypothetical protein